MSCNCRCAFVVVGGKGTELIGGTGGVREAFSPFCLGSISYPAFFLDRSIDPLPHRRTWDRSFFFFSWETGRWGWERGLRTVRTTTSRAPIHSFSSHTSIALVQHESGIGRRGCRDLGRNEREGTTTA